MKVKVQAEYTQVHKFSINHTQEESEAPEYTKDTSGPSSLIDQVALGGIEIEN